MPSAVKPASPSPPSSGRRLELKAGKKQQMESSSPDFDQESVIGPPGASGGGDILFKQHHENVLSPIIIVPGDLYKDHTPS